MSPSEMYGGFCLLSTGRCKPTAIFNTLTRNLHDNLGPWSPAPQTLKGFLLVERLEFNGLYALHAAD
jgi:hypothetical protein